MLRIVLLALTAALFYVANAQAHDVHAGCAYGPYHSGTDWHFHPGAYGQAVPCPPPGQGGGYGGSRDPRAPDPRAPDPYNPGYQGGYNPGYNPGYQGGDDDGYDDAPPPPPPPGYYRRRGYGYGEGYGGAPRPGDFGPQTNRAQDCYNVYGNRICCPKGWTVQNGQCQPYRGR